MAVVPVRNISTVEQSPMADTSMNTVGSSAAFGGQEAQQLSNIGAGVQKTSAAVFQKQR